MRRKNSDLELTAVKESSLVRVKVTKVIFIYKLTAKIRKKKPLQMLSLKEARFSLRFHITPKSPHPVDEKLE